jgi:hypothetical protein
MQLSPAACTPHSLGVSVSLSTLLSVTLRLCSSLGATARGSHRTEPNVKCVIITQVSEVAFFRKRITSEKLIHEEMEDISERYRHCVPSKRQEPAAQ